MDSLPFPKARGLTVRELAGELVIYDGARHRAFCLNPAAASIWKSCEGGASPAKAHRDLQSELGRLVPHDFVWLGVEQLRKAGLLEDGVSPEGKRPTRREVLRRIGAAGAALIPVVASLAVPPAVAAASCGGCNAKTGNNACNSAHCGVGAVCGKNCTKRCQPDGRCA
jgi:hypothetical protein